MSDPIQGKLWEAVSAAAQGIPGYLGTEQVGRAGIESEQYVFNVQGQRVVISVTIDDDSALIEEGYQYDFEQPTPPPSSP